MSSKVIEVFRGVDLRMGIDALKQYAKNRKCNTEDMKKGTGFIFLSADRRKAKFLTWNKLIIYMRAKDLNRPFDVTVFDEFIKTINPDGSMDYNAGLKAKLTAMMKERGWKHEEGRLKYDE